MGKFKTFMEAEQSWQDSELLAALYRDMGRRFLKLATEVQERGVDNLDDTGPIDEAEFHAYDFLRDAGRISVEDEEDSDAFGELMSQAQDILKAELREYFE
jgi:hypothetical protein